MENDLHRIRGHLGVEVRYSRETGGYIIRELEVPLLDLPDEDLATLGWLMETFGPGAPQHDAVHGLVHRLCLFLGRERRLRVDRYKDRYRSTLAVDLRQRDADAISSDVWERLTRALEERRWIAFDYISPRNPDRQPRRHIVAPVRRYFDPTRGHYYLRGWCQRITGPEGEVYAGRYITYRLGRMSHLRVLPDVLPPQLPRPPRYEVIYELSPFIARQGVSRHPEITVYRIEPQPDGGAIVYGETDDLFWAVQRLLQYGAGCRVRGGPELLAEMRRVVREMAELYRE